MMVGILVAEYDLKFGNEGVLFAANTSGIDLSGNRTTGRWSGRSFRTDLSRCDVLATRLTGMET